MKKPTQDSISIVDLTFTSFIYSRISKYDDSLAQLHKTTGPTPDLTDESHVHAILKWLRQWKCRNLEIRHESISARSIQAWYARTRQTLISLPESLRGYQGDTLIRLSKVFDLLKESWATPKKRIGPTPTAKLLYLLKTLALPPWDDFIRKRLGFDGSGRSYAAFVESCRRLSVDIEAQCAQKNVTLDEITRFKRPRPIGIAKAIDEYYWTRMTMKLAPPTGQELGIWLKLLTQKADHLGKQDRRESSNKSPKP